MWRRRNDRSKKGQPPAVSNAMTSPTTSTNTPAAERKFLGATEKRVAKCSLLTPLDPRTRGSGQAGRHRELISRRTRTNKLLGWRRRKAQDWL